MLSESLSAPIPPNDVKEKERGRELERWVYTLRGWESSLTHGGFQEIKGD